MKKISKITIITILVIIFIGIFCSVRADMAGGSGLNDRELDIRYKDENYIIDQTEKMRKMVCLGIGAVGIVGSLFFFLTKKEEPNDETKAEEPIKTEVNEETKKD